MKWHCYHCTMITFNQLLESISIVYIYIYFPKVDELKSHWRSGQMHL